MLEVSSTEIVFDLKNDVYTPYNLILKNITSQYLAYKIKSTKPDFFQVKQSRGIIAPNQKENVEFSTTDRTKNLDSKHIVNQKFQIYFIGLPEKKSTAEIDRLLQIGDAQNIRLQTCVYKEEFGKKVLIQGNNLAQSNASVLSNSRADSQSNMYSMIQPSALTNQTQCIQKLKQLDGQIAEEKRKREQLYNNIEIKKLKKSSSMMKFIVPIILGIVISNVYQLAMAYKY